MRLEPPRQVVPAGWGPADRQGVALAATARAFAARHAPILQDAVLLAAGVAAVVSRGDVLVLALLLALATLDLAAGAAAALVAVGVLARLGTTSLAALAGVQSVLGPAGASGPGMAALAAWLGAAALVLAAPSERAAPAFGVVAALIVNGPAATSLAGLVVRVLSMVALADLAVAGARWWPRSVTRPAAVAAGAGSLLAALVAAPPGGVRLAHVIRLASVPEAVALVAVGVGVLLLVPHVRPQLGRLVRLQYTPIHRRQPSGAGREGEL